MLFSVRVRTTSSRQPLRSAGRRRRRTLFYGLRLFREWSPGCRCGREVSCRFLKRESFICRSFLSSYSLFQALRVCVDPVQFLPGCRSAADNGRCTGCSRCTGSPAAVSARCGRIPPERLAGLSGSSHPANSPGRCLRSGTCCNGAEWRVCRGRTDRGMQYLQSLQGMVSNRIICAAVSCRNRKSSSVSGFSGA